MNSTNSRQTVLRDIAQQVGVSSSTVSRALRNLPGVGAKTRARIVALAKKRSYVPNQLARSLLTGRTNLIGLVTPPITHFTTVHGAMYRIQQLAESEGKRIVHLNLGGPDCTASAVARIVREQHWDGVLLYPDTVESSLDELSDMLGEAGIPVVFIDGPESERIDSVSYDRAAGMRLILDHAAGSGVRRVGVIGLANQMEDFSRSLKYATFMDDLRARGMELVLRIGITTGSSDAWGPALFRAAYEAMDRCLSRPCEADVVMACNDLVAFGTLNCLLDHGYRVPQDVCVTGYDDSEYAQYARPSLTSIRSPLEEIGELAWNMLKRRLDGAGGDARRAVLLPSLVVRGSTMAGE